MAAFVNDRTVLIMATAPRYTPPSDRGMFLSPSAAVFKVSADGQTVAPAAFTFKANLLNMSGAVAFTCSAGITANINGNELTITYANFSAVSGTVTATIVVEGVTYTATATISKVADGSPGTTGARGNVDIGAVTTGSVWSDTEAAAALSAAGYGGPRNRDMVTLYKADRTFSAQRMFDGFNWVAVNYVYNGNVFVKGSILPESIDTRELAIKDAAGNVIFSSGTNLDKSRVNANFGTNVLYNGDFSNGLDGWAWYSAAGSPAPGVAAVGTNLPGWWLSQAPNRPGSNVMYAQQSDAVRSANYNDGASYFEYVGPKVSVEVGKTYIVSGYSGAHRCTVNLFLYWLNSAGAVISWTARAGATSGFAANANEGGGGTTLAGYKRIHDYGVAPAGAAFCVPVIRKFATVAGQNDSYSFFGRVMIEEVPAAVTTPGPWSPGQSNTQITAANASTMIAAAAIALAHIDKATIANLQALSGTIGLLRTATSGQRSELSDNGLQLFNSSNVAVIQIGFN